MSSLPSTSPLLRCQEVEMVITGADIRWLRLALQQAEKANHPKWKVGAVVVRGGSVVGQGFNRYRNSPANVHHQDVSYHAEDVALRRAGDNASGSTIYVARLTMGGDLGLAKPCLRCQELLDRYNVHTVVWTSPAGISKSRISNLASKEAPNGRHLSVVA